ncbi:MAG TPA: hypothetical protein VE134_07320 [Methanomicrobiales archaeon]|nr:hypothetical protein [Methanomicrobiales archaeon]
MGLRRKDPVIYILDVPPEDINEILEPDESADEEPREEVEGMPELDAELLEGVADDVLRIDVSDLEGLPDFEMIYPALKEKHHPPPMPLPPARDWKEEVASKLATIEAQKRIRRARMFGGVGYTISSHSDGKADYHR